MDQARRTRKLLDWRPMGTRPVGRSRQRWQEVVMEDLKKLKVKNWKETAKDRRAWRDLAEKAKNPQRVVVPNDYDDVYEYFHYYIADDKLLEINDSKDYCKLTLRRLMSYIYIWSTHS